MTLLRLCAVALLLISSAPGASVKSWTINDYGSFLAGTLDAVTLSHEGQLRLAAEVVTVHDSDDPVTWTSAAGSDGTVYLGTGHAGRLYRVDPDGTAELLWTAPEIEIFALAVAPSGDVYVGTSPSGKVYRVTADGEATEFFDPGQQYIWRLQFGAVVDGGGYGGPEVLYVATGPAGEIYRVQSDGSSELWFDTQQRHVTALALAPDGALLAAADPTGIVYRISAKDEAFALYDSSLPEIRDIQVGADGAIYLAAMGGAISLSDNMTQSVSSAVAITATASGDPTSGTVSPLAAPQPVSTAPVASSAVINYGVETSALIVLRTGSRAETLWTSTQENILAMSIAEGEEPSILLATDRMGRMYRIDQQGHSELLTQTDEQQITSLLPSPRGLVMTAAHGSPTHMMLSSLADAGRYETAPFDALGVSSWGRLDWQGTGGVKLRTRSGNTARPDRTWSAWSDVAVGTNSGPIKSPSARYLQWAAELDSADQVLNSVRIAYLPANARPTIEAVTVSSESSGGGQTQSSAAAANPYTITVNADSGSTATDSDATAVSSSGHERLRISWAAIDLDGDELLASVEFRGEGETVWKTLKRDISDSFVMVDGDALADGRYRFRVTVSDHLDNPGDSARSADRISSEVLIDQTPPVVDSIATDAGTIRFSAEDAVSPIVEAHYSVDAARWVPLRSDDGLADSRTEGFTVQLKQLGDGEHLVTFRVKDQAGNTGLGKVLVTGGE
jgi:sugar lactone lactonase YvrE